MAAIWCPGLWRWRSSKVMPSKHWLKLLEGQFELETRRKEVNKINKDVSKLKRAGEDATKLIAESEDTKKKIAEKEVEVRETLNILNSKLETIGNNLIHDSVQGSNDETNNEVVRTWGEKRVEPKLKSRVDLVDLLGI
ncbi:serine-tRNA ligase-like [Trifolium medium]|uniref:Serine-tRNA ligase-like n=1 Tax=Trifolium medium TaxID=97028 RepID=A0A392M438_9FABA|nr:serine-tRNA ligase-like [Trifolium medium]